MLNADHVKCNWCGSESYIPVGGEYCPVCGEKGYLVFVNDTGDTVEVDDYKIVESRGVLNGF